MEAGKFPKFLIGEADRHAGSFLREQARGSVDALVVLGSGLAASLDDLPAWLEPIAQVRLSQVPGLEVPCADGHRDELCFYRGYGKTIAVASGRTHLYEGLGPGPVTALARAAYCAGIEAALLCNANGCLRDWNLGEVMVISDHVNFSGTSPFDGTVFLDSASCWDPELAASLQGICQHSGTYALMRGPEYQTRAETNLLAAAGVDCVGMSTVLEALMLHALGVRVAGLSVVSDLSYCALPTDPEEVVEAASGAAVTIRQALEVFLG